MEIPAKLVIQKMEAELSRLKESIDHPEAASSYREHAQSIKTYCELLLETQHTGTHYKSEKVRHASPQDVTSRRPAEESPKKRETIYDNGDEPASDSLLDF
jgi:hypothetical protein